MPYGQNLPQLDFSNPNPILLPQPIHEYGALVNNLNERYDTGLKLTSDLNDEISRLQTSDLEEDRRRGDMLQKDFMSTVDRIKGLGDYERQVTNLTKLIGDYKREATPLVARRNEFEAFKAELDANKNLSGASRQRIIQGVQNNLNADTDFRNTLDLHRFNDLKSSDANSQEIFQKAADGVLARLTDTRGRFKTVEIDPKTGDRILTFQDESQKVIKRSELENILRDELKNNSDLTSYISRESKLRGILGEEGDINQEMESSLQSVLDGRSGIIEDKKNMSPIGERLDKYGRPYGSDEPRDTSVVVGENSTAVKLDKPSDLISTGKSKKDIENTISKLTIEGKQGTEEYEYYNDVLNDLNYAEDKVYDNLIGINKSDKKDLKDNSYLSDEELQNKSFETVYVGGGLAPQPTLDAMNAKRIIRLRKTVNSQVEKQLKENPTLSINFTTYNSKDTGEYKSPIGAVNSLINEGLDGASYSVVNGTEVQGQDLQDYISGLKDTEINGVTYTPINKNETRVTNGAYFRGKPIVSVAIFGKDGNNNEKVIKTIPVTGGKISESSLRRANESALKNAIDNNDEILYKEALQGRYRLHELPNGKTIGSISSMKNINNIPDGSGRTFYTDIEGTSRLQLMKSPNGDGTTYLIGQVKDQKGDFIDDPSINYRILNQNHLENVVYGIFNPQPK